MKTYARRLMELKDYTPENAYFTSGAEARRISETLGLKVMQTELELRNMRDMAVMFFSSESEMCRQDGLKDESIKAWKAMQSITAVIDGELIARGYGA